MTHIPANDPNLTSWVDIPQGHHFPIQNLPFGIFSVNGDTPRVGVAIGDNVLDLPKVAELGLFADLDIDTSVFSQPTLNAFIALGQAVWRATRNRLSSLISSDNPELQEQAEAEGVLIPQAEVEMHLPVFIRDYTDFYSSIEHATNIGTMFRGKENALMPNWKHLPVGYHGRASSIIVSGTPIHRPKGQTRPNMEAPPVYGSTRLLDFELEMGFIVGKATELGEQVSTAAAESHIFGMLVFNDWSARDIQKWEYVPLGPFLGKSFASSVSPWIVTLDALEPFRVAGPKQDPPVLPYLQYEGNKNYDIKLEVIIETADGQSKTVCRSNMKYMYWNMMQQLAHHTVNGCNLNVGDMMASGTISGKSPESYGSMLELTWRGTKPIEMPDGSVRKFIQDGDSVIMRAYSEGNGYRIGFGEVRTKVLPAK